MVAGEDEQVLLNPGKESLLDKENSSSSSSSSDSSEEEDFIQIDAGELDKSISGNEIIHKSNSKLGPHAGEDVQLASRVDARDGQMTTPNGFPGFKVGNLEDSASVGVKQSPPVQVMVRADAPDPYRIPSSIFERSKSTTPMEWSAASNESLFSIHMGNSSFSRDHVFLLGRSGELSNFTTSPPDAYPPIPRVSNADMMKVDFRIVHEQVTTSEAANADTTKDVLSNATDGHVHKEKHPVEGIRHCASTPRRSDASTQSFAFPILTDGSNSMKVEPENQFQPQRQMKAPNYKEAPEVVPDAAQSKWFPCCSCSLCS